MKQLSSTVFAIFQIAYFTSAVGTQVLILGGNGMLGSETAFKLITDGIKCTITNRGNWYWDSAERVLPSVRHIFCNRASNIFETCPELIQDKESYRAIIDFSSYYPDDLEAILDAFKGRFQRYIFISSDSVYEVCKKNSHGGFNKEDDSIRPENEDERKLLAEKDRYGDRKLQCEKVLKERSITDHFYFISLRLPDVIGPRDNTGRWWPYHLWLYAAKYLSRPVLVGPSSAFSQISLVYSEDVAQLILNLINMRNDVFNQAYNLAFRSTGTLEELILLMSRASNITDLPIKEERNLNTYLGIPSVTRGPIDISNAIRKLEWNPTTYDTAVYETVSFYEKAISDERFRGILRNSLKKINVHPEEFLKMYRTLQSRTKSHVKDEL